MNSIEEFGQFADSTGYLIIEEDLYNNLYEDFASFIHDLPVLIISDENTEKAAGNDFIKFCRKNNILIEKEFVFPAEPELTADYKNIETLLSLFNTNSAVPVAIGSGTINDLVKRAAFEAGRKYAVIATAASVDGYASDGAAILYKGLKQTLPCSAPTFIGADPSVLKNAPIEMASSGYADLIAKNPAGADWIIADSVGLDQIVPEVWQLIQGNLRGWVANPDKIMKKDKEAFGRVFKGLTVSGFAMQFMKRSRPVSGAEHLMSHIWEMNNHTYKGKHISHGFKVAIGSLASVALMETMIQWELTDDVIAEALEKWPTWENRKNDVEDKFRGMAALDDLLVINKDKYINKDQLAKRLELLSQNWTELKKLIKTHLIPYGEYKRKLKQAGCPVSPEEIGLTRDLVVETYIPAQMMRDRYSILDLAYETGMLGLCSYEILDSDIYLI